MRVIFKISLFILLSFFAFSLKAQQADTTAADSTQNDSFFPADGLKKINKQAWEDLKKEWLPQDVLEKIKVSGTVQFMAFYRSMNQYYPDLATSPRNLSFIAYPSATSTGNSTGPPLMELEIEGRPMPGSVFKVGYSTRQFYTGQLGDTSRNAFIRELLKFEAVKYTDFGTFKLVAGGGANWLNISPMTLSNKNFRVDPFDKLPWDWYNNSNKKYLNYHKNPGIRTDERFLGAPVQGFSLDGTGLPGGFGFLVFYGRSNRSVLGTDINLNIPANLFVTRVDKSIRQHKVGLNYYSHLSNTDNVHGREDRRMIVSTDLRLRLSRFRIFTELGGGKIINPSKNSSWDPAVDFRMEVDKSITKIPVYLQYYQIGLNVVSQESAVMQSNTLTPSGGYQRSWTTDNNLDLNVLQETGMLANNRRGGSLKMEEKFGPFKVEIGTSASQELQNVNNIITVQHRAFSFTRSRFRPFTNNSGPYQRVSNRNRRSYERIAVTDTVVNYKKGFNTLDLTVKYLVKFLNHDLIFANNNFYGSVSDGFSPIPGFDDKPFIRTFYEEFSMFYLLTKKVVLLGSVSTERVMGNTRTVLSPENNKPMDQTSMGYGVGIDYDFGDRAGLYIRHRWIRQTDKNFMLDKFRGQETQIELKVFF
ncbi:MAG: hypothetical protein K2X86_10090 [Cytophagaceae bacterium]|nr:hypothetical protein [Cytophagaceae bacterium]